MRRLLVAMALLGAGTACSDTDTSSRPPMENTILPDETTPAPGACDETIERLPIPVIVIDGVETDATLGVGAWECGNLTGTGFITFVYNPVLLDASQPVDVIIDGEPVVELTWPLGEPFNRVDDSRWRSAEPVEGCSRLIIRLESATGRSTAIYGADIRVGGERVECPQRVLDPSDPDITNQFDSLPFEPPSTVPRSTVPPSTT